MKQRLFVVIALLLVASLPLTSCANAVPATGTATEKATEASTTEAPSAVALATQAPTTTTAAQSSNQVVVNLSYWNGLTGADPKYLENIIKEFNDSHPNIHIENNTMPWDTFNQKVPTALTAGNGPDIITLYYAWIPKWVEGKYVISLDDYIPTLSADAKPSVLDAGKYKGKYYAAMQDFFSMSLYYNKDLFKAAGLDPNTPPSNWDELLADAAKLTKNGNYGLLIPTRTSPDFFPIFAWENGGEIVGADGKAAVNTDAWIGAYTYLKQFFDKGYSPVGMTGPQTDELFTGGKAGMHITGPWMADSFKKAGLNFGVAKIPAGKIEATQGGGDMLLITSNCKHPKEAWEFIKWWNSPQVMKEWSMATKYPPANLIAAKDPEILADPVISVFASQLDTAKFFAPGQINNSEIENVIYDANENVAYGKMSIKDALNKANDEINKLLSPQ